MTKSAFLLRRQRSCFAQLIDVIVVLSRGREEHPASVGHEADETLTGRATAWSEHGKPQLLPLNPQQYNCPYTSPQNYTS